MFRVALVAQGTFDFEEGSLNGWTQSPPDRWEISAEGALEGLYSLHHSFDNATSGVDFLGREIGYADFSDTISVSFRVRHGYNPSSNNNWQLFLLANAISELEPGKKDCSAFIAGVNYACSDDMVKIWQLYRGNVTEVCSGGMSYQAAIGTSGEPLFSIIRYPGGSWSLSCDAGGSGDSLVLIGEGHEAEQPAGKYLGVRYSYSSLQDRKLWVDGIRIEGCFSADTVSPMVFHHGISGVQAIEITFSEEVIVKDSSFVWQQFPGDSQEEGIRPDSVNSAGQSCRLIFCNDFPNRREQYLWVRHIADLEGNVLGDTVLLFYQDLADFGDIVITEIMPDPEPCVYLPPCEYVEILNRYHEAIDVTGWMLRINNTEYVLDTAGIVSGGYLLLTHLDGAGKYGEVSQQSIIGSATALPNSGGKIELLDQYGRMVHMVEYESMERYDNNRSDGGWSLERPDPDNLCGGFENWVVSGSWRGGTPGSENSLRTEVPDYVSPQIKNIGLPDSLTVLLTFDEPVLLNPGGEHRFRVDTVAYEAESGPLPAARAVIELRLNEPLEGDVVYVLEVSGVGDCAGNIAGPLLEEFRFPVLPRPGVPLINEVMYDPVTGGEEYFELFHSGKEYLDLKDLRFRVTTAGSLNEKLTGLSRDSHLLAPGEYVVFTRNSRALREEWGLDRRVNVVEVEEWRALSNEGACLQVTGRGGELLDMFCYHDSMHHDMVGILTGVALERIHCGACELASQCWTSAAASVNYGTPGRENSQRIASVQYRSGLQIHPEVFSPDNDGFEDILEISLPDGDPGKLVDVFITGIDGQRVRDIILRGIKGTNDTFYWYGHDNEGRSLLPGIYIVHVVISGERQTKILRKACALKYR